MKLRKLFALLMAAVMLLGMMPMANAELTGCNHDWDSGKWLRGEPSNCQDWKPKTYTCTICGATATNEECGPCVPGNKTWVVPQASNCQEHGVWEIACKYCGEWLEGMEEPGPHKWSETIVEEPWCDVGGMKAMSCSVCGEWQGNGTPLAPLGHDWGSWNWAHGSAPSCTEGAWQVRECQRCGRMEDRYVQGSNHKFGEWITTIEPTCTERGRHHHKCTVCGYSEWAPIPTVDHVWGDWRVIEEPQVGIPGTERRSCTFGCGTHEDRDIPPLEETLSAEGLELTLVLTSTPANGEYFVVGEEVVFTENWVNNTGKELYPFYVSIWTYPNPEYSGVPDIMCSWDAEETGPVTPGQSGSHQLVTTVTEADVARGAIYAMAIIISTENNGADLADVTTPFVTAPCAPAAVVNSAGVRLEKELRNAPANGEYYVPGEVLNYALTLILDDGLILDDAAIYDPIVGGDGLVMPGGKGLYGGMGKDVFYVVTEEDAERGYVENTAYATWIYQDSGEAGRCESETVIAICGMGELPEGYEPTGILQVETVATTTPVNGTHYVEGETVILADVFTNCSANLTLTGSDWVNIEILGKGIFNRNADFGADAVLAPGESKILLYSTYVITAEDVPQGYIQKTVHAGFVGDDGMFYTGSFEIRIPCAPEETSYATSIKLEVFDVPSVTAEWAGDVYPVKVKVTNTGDTTVDLCDFAFVDANGNTCLNAILYDWNKYAIDPPCDWLPAGASLTTDLEFAVTQSGIAAGELRFNLVQYAAPWYAQVGDQYTDTPADVVPAPEGTTGYYSKTDAVVSDTVEIVVPINQGEDESAAEGLTVTKTASAGSYSDPCKPGDVVTFTITVTNNTGEVLTDVEITDPIKGGNEDSVVDIIPSMQPGESVTAFFNYTVTEEDATVGVEGFENTAYAIGYTADGTQVSGTSETIFVWCVVEHELTFFKSIANVPANGVFFVPGETIEFEISMFNHTPYPLYNIILTDPLCQDQYTYDAVNDMSYLYFGELYNEGNAMGESTSATVTVSYVVTEADAEAGSVTNTAEVTYQTWYGKEITDSDGATAPCGVGELPVDLSLTVSDPYGPANGTHYVRGERAQTVWRIKNNSNDTVINVLSISYGWNDDAFIPPYASNRVLDPGDATFIRGVGWYVTQEDVTRGYITIDVVVVCGDGENEYTLYDSLQMPCGPGELPDDYVPPVDDDIDEDGIPNGEDPDADGDGIPNDEDSEPFGPDGDAASAPVVVTKAVANTPANGEYFVVGETIDFSITVTNNSGYELAGMIITDALDVDWICEPNELLLPGESRTETFSYVVTELDAAAGSVANYATVRIIEADGYHFFTSNVVTAPCSPSGVDGDMEYPVYNGYVTENPFGVITDLEVTKAVESLPLNGLYYTEGETVAYRITYVNIGETPLTDVMIYDSLAGMTEIASAETLDVGESRFCVFNYTVTAEDVARGYVSNTAIGQFEIDGYLHVVASETVIVDTDGQPDPEIPEGILPPGGVIDVSKLNIDQYCRRVTSSRTNVSYSWGTSFCSDHANIQGNILMMEQAATTPAMQMQTAAYAVALWRAEVDKLYEELLGAADPQARAVIMAEYVSFLTHASNYETLLNALYPDQPALVVRKMADLWEEKCITLCQEMHMPVAARQDSFLAVEIATMEGISDACTCVTYDEGKGWNNFEQNYCPAHSFPFVMIDMLLAGQDTAEAWTTVRQIWNVELRSGYNKVIALLGENSDVALADYATLESWMIAREAELTLLYPDNPELVAQTMVRIVIDQVNALCQLAQ